MITGRNLKAGSRDKVSSSGGDGVHTTDLYGEGTLGAVKTGTVNAYLGNDGNGYFSGKLKVEGDLAMGSGKTISNSSRLHISGGKNLFYSTRVE